MKFGQKSTVASRGDMAKARFGDTKAKDTKPLPKAKVKPTGKLGGGGRIGFKITKQL